MKGKDFLIALDQAANTLIKLSDGYGTPDEMLSARAWRLRNKHPNLRKFIDGVVVGDVDHCEECYLIEKNRQQLPREYAQ